MSILAYGDPHGEWRPLLRECERALPQAVLLAGDCDLARPLRAELTALWRAGVAVLYVPGNHDTDTAEFWDHLVGDHPTGNLHGRVAAVAGLRVAGFGGTFERPVWDRRADGTPVARVADRAAYVAGLRGGQRLDGWLPLRQRATPFPEDFDALLAAGPADILLCHEAPSTHRFGVADLDALADALGVRLVIHGHHHRGYTATLPSGVRVRGLGKREVWTLEV